MTRHNKRHAFASEQIKISWSNIRACSLISHLILRLLTLSWLFMPASKGNKYAKRAKLKKFAVCLKFVFNYIGFYFIKKKVFQWK